MNNAEKFENLCKEIHREGFDDFYYWLITNTDFVKAPASTRFHGAYEGGLLEHSINVCFKLFSLAGHLYTPETICIVSLFHDICKANFYKISTRNVKNEKTNKWEKVPYYMVDEEFPYGAHGGKSVYLMMAHGLKITDEEATAINCHMGGWDYTTYHNPSKAFETYPLAVYLHIADIMATYIDKK